MLRTPSESAGHKTLTVGQFFAGPVGSGEALFVECGIGALGYVVIVPAFGLAADVFFLGALSAVGAKLDVLVDKRLATRNLPGRLHRHQNRKEKPPPERDVPVIQPQESQI